MDRKERLLKAADKFNVIHSPEGPYQSTMDEDASEAIYHSTIEGWAVFTKESEGRTTVVTVAGDLVSAKSKALENIDDNIFAEVPVAIVGLDSGIVYRPFWPSVEWEQMIQERLD